MADKLVQENPEVQQTSIADGTDARSLPFRIGHGYDVHRFGSGDHIVLAGVNIPYHAGFIAHSDGDVLIHALCDALLGAIAAGDIGRHFPDNDKRYKNINSQILLEKVIKMVSEKAYIVANIDTTIIAQTPKLSAYIQPMQDRLATIFSLSAEQVNIKATTTEHLGFTGREEGIAVHAVVMIYKKHPDG